MTMRWQGVVLSPGPCDPDRAGICLDLIKTAAGKLPILGVCLGHQAIGQALGGRGVGARPPLPVQISSLEPNGEGNFHGISQPLSATRYPSLALPRGNLPGFLVSSA